MFSLPGGMEWIIILIVVALIFGTSKLRHIGRDLGGAISEFKDSVTKKEGEEPEEEKVAKSEPVAEEEKTQS